MDPGGPGPSQESRLEFGSGGSGRNWPAPLQCWGEAHVLTQKVEVPLASRFLMRPVGALVRGGFLFGSEYWQDGEGLSTRSGCLRAACGRLLPGSSRRFFS